MQFSAMIAARRVFEFLNKSRLKVPAFPGSRFSDKHDTVRDFCARKQAEDRR
jgi:hypothetical protein